MKLDSRDRGEIEAFGDFLLDHEEEVRTVVEELKIDKSKIIDFARGTLLLMTLGLLAQRNYDMESKEIVDFVNLLIRRRSTEIESRYRR